MSINKVLRTVFIVICALFFKFSALAQGPTDPLSLITTVDTISLCPNQDFWIPVRLQNAVDIGSINLVLCFDVTVIQYLSQYTFPPELIPGFLNVNCPGCLRVGWFAITPFDMLDDTVISFKFHYSGGVTPLTWNLSESSYSNHSGVLLPTVFNGGEVNSYGLTAVITNQPQNVNACESSDAVVTAGVQYGITYQWQSSSNGGLNWTNLNNDAVFSGVDTTVLHITGTPLSLNGYLVRLKIVDSCTAVTNSAPATLHVQAKPVVNAGIDDSICAGSTFTLSGTSSNDSIVHWTSSGTGTFTGNGTLTPVYTPSTADQTAGHVFLILKGHGFYPCEEVYDTMRLTIHAIPVANAGNDTTICAGGLATLHGSGGLSYTWSTVPPQTTQTVVVNPTVNTTYFVTVSNYGCTDVDDIVVSIQSGPFVNAGPDGSICADQTYSLSGIVQNVSDFMWSTTGDGSFSDQTVLNPVYTPGILDIANGSVYLVLSGLPNSPCLMGDYDSLLLTLIPLPLANAGPDVTVCKGLPATLVATGGSTYVWNTVPPVNNDTLIVTPTDTAFYVVTVSNGQCSATDTAFVNVLPLPVLTLTHDTMICSGDSIVLSAFGGLSYLWSTGDFIGSITVFPTVMTTYTVTITDNHTCHSSGDVTVTVNASLNSSVSPLNPTICEGGSINLSASASHPSVFTWSPGTGLSTTTGPIVIASPDKTMHYTVTATDGMGCTSVTAVTLLVYQNPPVEVHPPLYDLCLGDTLSLTAYGASSYYWSPSTGLSANNLSTVLASPKHSVVYTLTGTDQHNCSTSVTSVINVLPVPVTTLPDSIYICRGENYQLDANGHLDSCTYTWQDGSTQPYAYVSNPGLYYVTVVRKSCSITDSVLVKACSELWVPNAFTPNNDGINDLFYVSNTSDLTEFHMVIYNRWGERVFNTNNPYEPWDGNYDGKRCPAGVYHYVIEYVGQGNVLLEKEGKKYGFVTLFR